MHQHARNVRHMRHHDVPHYEAVPGWLGNLSPSPVNNQQVERTFIWVCCDNRVREQPRGRKSPSIRHAWHKPHGLIKNPVSH